MLEVVPAIADDGTRGFGITLRGGFSNKCYQFRPIKASVESLLGPIAEQVADMILGFEVIEGGNACTTSSRQLGPS